MSEIAVRPSREFLVRQSILNACHARFPNRPVKRVVMYSTHADFMPYYFFEMDIRRQFKKLAKQYGTGA